MPTYVNGRIPADLLIVFDKGTDSEGYWEHALSPATLARHRALVKLALKHTGRDLKLGPGWRCYRPYAQQVRAREIHGNWAAVPGTSSHGGTFEGQQTLAMDYGWWDWVYEKFGTNKRAVWYADCRAVGLTPGLIEPRRGYPDEPWHVVDENPWVMPSYASTDSNPLEDDMIDDANAKKIAKAVWAQYVGDRDNQWTSYGTAGGLLAQTHARAGNAASRIAAVMAETEGPLTPAQIDAIAVALKTDLGKAVAVELSKRLAS